ncbi:Mad3/BUB1 homology region 1-domain-containing protein [Hypoxylon cercidicola]|nr:Mad3/BUB1 homology region 1-domain-containing protein [Hypoxylon cercidicola]
MAAGDLIDFDIIEGQKENIQSLPGGRSAKKLVEVFSPSPLHKLATPTPTDTKNINDCIRAEYEAEVANISESDDPLDVFDRYVRWTFDAYPSAQATPQSQLHALLERATKTFIGSAQYKNDPRYLKLWLHYIRFFSDSPRETYVFLSRHSIGEGLALFYEEYAAWLESVGRWGQAEEVYKLGIEREARPVQRLVRKFGEFEQRRAQQPDAGDAPSSPALPTVRPALAAKIDPFGAAARAAADPQAPRPTTGVGGQSSKTGKAKLAVFSDASSDASAMSKMGEGAKGWDTIGSLGDRKKENVMGAKPWVGETLTTQVKKSSGPKMSVFRDPSLSRIAESHIVIAPSKHQVIVNPQSGKRERVFVNLEAIYPTPEEPGTELSFEELWAASQGWLDVCWEDDVEEQVAIENPSEVDLLGQQVAEKLVIHHDMHHDMVELDENGAVKNHARPAKSKKKKVMEVNETQIIKAKLDSPSGPKIKKKMAASSEPTMTMHTKAATDDIYDIFNAPLNSAPVPEEAESDDDYTTDGDYTSGAESVNTTRRISTSEVGEDDETSDVKSVSEWSDFTAQKHIPKVDGETDNEEDDVGNESDLSDLIDTKDPEDDDDAKNSSPKTRTSFIPIAPEGYEAPTRPYRDPAEVANSRLPFMTPITERTESSLGLVTEAKPQYASTKTLSKRSSLDVPLEEDEGYEDFEPPSSPLQEVFSDARTPSKIVQPLPKKIKVYSTSPDKLSMVKEVQKGPIIKETRCNPLEEAVRDEIMARMFPPLSSYSGFYDHRGERSERGAEIRKFAKAVAKAAGKKENDKTGTLQTPVVLEFPELMNEYTLKRELGAGAFAPVYLVENSSPESAESDENSPRIAMGKGAFATTRRAPLEALKMEDPPTAWEFHMMRLAAARLGPQHRATASISAAHELHLYQDEGFLILPYHPHGTLLDVVNFFAETSKAPMDEVLAMFFSVELLRTVEALHAKQILHGDLKPDNCLLRLDETSGLSSQWRADGSGGWAARGVTLIDFGRGIDMRAFGPDVQFVADWKTDTQDCAEAREGRPWTWQLDYHGLANNLHTLLFGKYIDVVRADAGGLGLATSSSRRYRIREPLKRYWQTDLWTECFDVLLNPAGHLDAEDGRRLPAARSLRRVRERMEAWLEANCERGVGLKTLVARVEGMAKSRRH